MSFVPRIAKDLGPFLLVTTEDTLSLVLETLSVVVEVDDSKWMTSDLAHSLVVAVLDVWAKNNKGDEGSQLPDYIKFTFSLSFIDPIFLSIFADIFTALASSRAPNVYETVVKQALPALCSAIGSAKPDESWIAGSAIDLVGSLVKGAPDGGLGDGFFSLLAPNLFTCLAQAEDRDVLQVGQILDVIRDASLLSICDFSEWRRMSDPCHSERL